MHRDELLAEITHAFQDAPHPGGALNGPAWPDLSDDFLREQLPMLASLSSAGFRYYLPVFLCFALREPVAQRLEPLLTLLKLPTELPGPAVTELLSYFEAASLPPVAVGSLMQQQLSQTNQALHVFMARVSQLTPLQAKAVYHFLIHLRDAGSAHQQELAVVIERYWFQFA